MAEPCTTMCDPDCPVACHEVHAPIHKRLHDVSECIAQQCADPTPRADVALTEAERQALGNWMRHRGVYSFGLLCDIADAIERILAARTAARDVEVKRLTNKLASVDAARDEARDSAEAAEAERDEARAERDRLRAVVERVEALADEWSDASEQVPSKWAAGRVRAALTTPPTTEEA